MTTPCIPWAGPTMNMGYGLAYVASSGYGAKDARSVLAHALAWEQEHGPVPKGFTVHHRCENKLCVNVEHMELLTRKDHAGAGGHGKLTQRLADEIRWLRERGWRGDDVATAYGVSVQQVCNIFRGRCWA
jgi:hypothetical protein